VNTFHPTELAVLNNNSSISEGGLIFKSYAMLQNEIVLTLQW